MMRLKELLETATNYLQQHQVESPRLTIELFLANLLGKTRLELYLAFDQEIQDSERQRLREWVKRRVQGEPLEYILGYKEFDGHRFEVTPAVLIPRPETEILLRIVLSLVEEEGLPLVDVGTGSGVLALSLARHFPQLKVFGLDSSEAALTLAKKNTQGVENVRWTKSHLLEAFEGKAQLIVANLPYIPSGDLSALSREVRCEPSLALDGGKDGLALIGELIKQSQGRTNWLALEIGDGQVSSIKKLFKTADYKVTLIECDFTQTERVIVGQYDG